MKLMFFPVGGACREFGRDCVNWFDDIKMLNEFI